MKKPPQEDQSSLVIAVILGFVSLYLLPATYYLVPRLLCRKTLSLKQTRIRAKKTKCRTSTALHLPLTAFCWAITVFMIVSVPEDTGPLNPYSILRLKYGEGSTRKIKKAYRKLSLQYHPDKVRQRSKNKKNNDDPAFMEQANAKFIEISEAYRTLTDDASFENWKTYGHPDGPRWQRGLQNAPLPSFLLVDDAGSSTSTLALLGYALLIIGIPIGCICVASNEKHSNDRVGDDRKHYMDQFKQKQQYMVSVCVGKGKGEGEGGMFVGCCCCFCGVLFRGRGWDVCGVFVGCCCCFLWGVVVVVCWLRSRVNGSLNIMFVVCCCRRAGRI